VIHHILDPQVRHTGYDKKCVCVCALSGDFTSSWKNKKEEKENLTRNPNA